MSSPVAYRVRLRRPHAHLLDVEARFPATPDTLTLSMPVWTPGSYLVREYARHVQELVASDESGRALPLTRVDKRTVAVQAGGAAVTLRYAVYANELTVRTNHFDHTHASFNGAAVFFFCEALRSSPHAVEVEAPAGWRVHVALPERGGRFVAEDFDALVDAPFEVGPQEPLRFTVRGQPHEVVLWGEPQLDRARLLADLEKVVETQAAFFGGLPEGRYVFLLYASDKGRGGLEHRDSTALLYTRTGFSTQRGWEDFITLAAHEYFHRWNVKRVRPRAFVPFDYSQENHTELLWFFEGGTSYYDSLLVRRAGLMSPARYLVRLGEALTALKATPGRLVLPLVEASWLAWIKHYRPDENSPNSAISYYLKGEVVCALLDLHLRAATSGARSLDDVVRTVLERFGVTGVPEDGVDQVALELGGPQLKPFLDAALRSTQELDLSIFSTVGLEARSRKRESPGDKGGTPPRSKADRAEGHLGVLTRGASTIATVLEGSPAQAAGLYADDEVVALDGYRCDAAGLLARCEERRPGEVVRVTVFRRDALVEVPVTLGPKPLDAIFLAKVDAPSDAQRAAYQAWLGSAWDEER